MSRIPSVDLSRSQIGAFIRRHPLRSCLAAGLAVGGAVVVATGVGAAALVGIAMVWLVAEVPVVAMAIARDLPPPSVKAQQRQVGRTFYPELHDEAGGVSSSYERAHDAAQSLQRLDARLRESGVPARGVDHGLEHLARVQALVLRIDNIVGATPEGVPQGRAPGFDRMLGDLARTGFSDERMTKLTARRLEQVPASRALRQALETFESGAAGRASPSSGSAGRGPDRGGEGILDL